MKVVVIGNGMAGFRFCQLVSERHDPRIKTVVFGEERSPAYDRVHLTEYLARPHVDHLLLSPRSWYEHNQIELRTGERIAEIDRRRCLVRSANGRETEYDKLVLATGSLPFEPPIPGVDAPGVFVYRTVDDLEAIRIRASVARRAIVIGGGLLGLEAARALQKLGLDVSVFEGAPRLMPRQLDAASAATLEGHVRSIGLDVRVGVKVRGLRGHQRSVDVALGGGAVERADLVVIAAGVRPRDAIARHAELEVGPRGGVAVDDGMQSSDERILAIGECASHDGVVYGMVNPCYEMARVAADRVHGKSTRFAKPNGSWRLKLAGIEATVVGQYDPERPGVSHESEDGRRTLSLDGDRLVGACGIGSWPDAWRLDRVIERRAKISDRQLQRFRATGSFWPRTTQLPVMSWPATASVCNCRSISRGDLSTALRAGARTVPDICKTTGAGTVCGSCKPLLAELCQQPSQAAEVGGGGGALWKLSLIALLGCAAILAVPVTGWQLGQATGWQLLEDAKISGFAVLGTCVLASLLSLRKRIRWFRFGSFGGWRAVHAGIGVLGLGLVGAHTGMSIGDNFNRLVALAFLGAVATGSLTGIIAAVESSGSGAAAMIARRYRRPVSWSHWLFLWTLPALIGFHVVLAYYF